MKVILDLDALKRSGDIDDAEYEKLKQLAKRSTTALAFSLLVGFGVITVCTSVLVLLPTPATVIAVGLALAALGLLARSILSEDWSLFAGICMVVGALLFAGGVIAAYEASSRSFLIAAAALFVAGVVARNALLIATSVVALAWSIGSYAGYDRAGYFLGIEEPTLTILFFTMLALGAYDVAKRLPPVYERLAGVAAQVSVFVVNFAFWIGSLLGDQLRLLKQAHFIGDDAMIPPAAFAVVWALLLIAAAVWAVRTNRRWLLNVAVIFGVIHFYTQWFEKMGAEPMSVLLAGLLALALALGLWRFNKQLFAGAG